MFEQAFRNIDDALRKEAGCATELDYSEQTSWLLFLKYLDGLEQDRATEAMLEGRAHTPILDPEFRWEFWAAPKDASGQLDRPPDEVDRHHPSPGKDGSPVGTLRTNCHETDPALIWK